MPGCTVTLIFLCIAGLARSLTLNSSVPLFDSTSKLFKQISADLAPYAAGINSTMVDSVYCSTRAPGFRLQIKNQEVFIAGEVHGFQSRNRNIKLALLEVASHFADLPDIDLVIGSDDFSAEDHGHSGPILAQAKRLEHTTAVLFPDHTFTDWQEADTVGWQHQQYIMHKSALHTPWATKDPKLMFRGSSMTGNRAIAAAFEATDLVDVRVWDWVREPEHDQFVGLPDHCKSKYLLNWPGNSYSARLKYLLLCGSVVVHSDNGWYEFYYPMLKHGQNFMKTRALAEVGDFTNGLTTLVQHLSTNPKRSRLIAEAGQQLATDVLSSQNIREYWYRLLVAYSQLQTFRVMLCSDAIPLGDSLSHPQYGSAEHRTRC